MAGVENEQGGWQGRRCFGFVPVTGFVDEGAHWTPRQRGRRFLRRAQYALGHHPGLLPILVRLTPEGTAKAITRRTELVIEGFPRSGNTFAVFALRQANGGYLRVPTHVHQPAQVKRAVRLGLPTVVVIREPVEALASNLIFSRHVLPEEILREYVRYHQELVPLLGWVVVAAFEEIITGSGAVIDRVNRRFGTRFRAFSHEPSDVEAVFAAIERRHGDVYGYEQLERFVPRPAPDRAEAKAWFVQQLTAPEHGVLLAEARALHQRFLATRAMLDAGG